MFTKKDENNLFIKSIVLALMKNGKVYTVKVITNLRGDISKAVCGCPAGVDGRCNHLPVTHKKHKQTNRTMKFSQVLQTLLTQ